MNFPIKMVTIRSNPYNKDMFNEYALFYISVKIELYKTNNLVKC